MSETSDDEFRALARAEAERLTRKHAAAGCEICADNIAAFVTRPGVAAVSSGGDENK